MSQITGELGAHLALHAFRGADIFGSFLAGVEANKERRAARRAAGVDRVTELGALYHEALADQAAATDAARALAEENTKLRAELAAARGQVVSARRTAAAEKARADRAETAILAHARRIRAA